MLGVASLIVTLSVISPLAQLRPNTVSTDRVQNVKQVQTRVEETREQMREEFRQNLQRITDERKQTVVENIYERIAAQNEKWVNHWNNVLTRLTSILDKAESRVESSASTEADLSSFNLAMDNAREAIRVAQAAVDEQAGKTYQIEITDETTLGQVVRSTIADFRNDLRATMGSVQEAKEAVVEVMRHLKDLASELESDNEQ